MSSCAGFDCAGCDWPIAGAQRQSTTPSMTVPSMTVINKFQRPRRIIFTLEHPQTWAMGTDESVNLFVNRTSKCRSPIRRFKADAASDREIMRLEPVSVNVEV